MGNSPARKRKFTFPSGKFQLMEKKQSQNPVQFLKEGICILQIRGFLPLNRGHSLRQSGSNPYTDDVKSQDREVKPLDKVDQTVIQTGSNP